MAWTDTLVDELAECVASSWVSEDDDMVGWLATHAAQRRYWGFYLRPESTYMNTTHARRMWTPPTSAIIASDTCCRRLN
jgi:hypothetical protein